MLPSSVILCGVLSGVRTGTPVEDDRFRVTVNRTAPGAKDNARSFLDKWSVSETLIPLFFAVLVMKASREVLQNTSVVLWSILVI